MIKTLKVTFTIWNPKYFFCFGYVRGKPSLWVARSAEAPVRHVRAEADKRALEPLSQSADRAEWASQHVGPPAEAEQLAAVDQGAEPEPETETERETEPVPLHPIWNLWGYASAPPTPTPTVTRTLVTKAHPTTFSPRLRVIAKLQIKPK